MAKLKTSALNGNAEVMCATGWGEVQYVRDGLFSSIGGRFGLADKWQNARGSGSMLHRIHRRIEQSEWMTEWMNERQSFCVSIGRLFTSWASYNYFTHFLHIASKIFTPTSRSDEWSLPFKFSDQSTARDLRFQGNEGS